MTGIREIKGCLFGEKYKAGLKFDFSIAIPEQEAEEYALLVEHDGKNDANIESMLKLAEEGKAPYCVSLGVCPGVLTVADGSKRNMRMNSYDLFDHEYADFIVRELIPYICDTYQLKISASPDWHFVSGGSSGGISAFVMAWFHPEYFHRVYMCSPSFLAMGRGNELPYLIRKYETKPLRIYQEMSENEPNDYFGWSRGIDEETDLGLMFAGYDYRSAYFEGEGHCSRYRNAEEAYKRNEWIWQDYKAKPITAPSNSPRVNRVIPGNSSWTPCAVFSQKVPTDIPAELCGYECAVCSVDGMTWYGGSKDDDIVYMHPAGKEQIGNRYLHAALHTIPRIGPRGAIDMAIDAVDRLYVLTAIGIQCVRAFGLIDVILDLPDDAEPIGIAVSDALYVKTGKGIYRRPLCEDCTDFEHPQRKYTKYYN